VNAAARSKTDVLALKNGDRVTCEFKQLSAGKLEVSTDAMGTIYVEWADIVALRSEFYFRVENSKGLRHFGSLGLDEGATELHVRGDEEIASFEMSEVVEIIPLEKGFWQRMEGSLSFGFDFRKSTDVSEITFDWDNLYKTERNLVHTDVGATLTDQSDETTRSAKVTLSYTRLLKRKRSGTVSVEVERDDALDLARRFLGSVGAGVTPVKRNRSILRLEAGLAVNSELATDGTQATESLEAFLTARYSLFQYNTPKTDIDTKLDVYASLTESDRYRVEFDTTLRRELIKDFFVGLTYELSYDSNSTSGEGDQRDYSIETSVGYSY
jgi:hypothetical protein